MTSPPCQVREPVWWGARLRVATDAVYTEVAGHAVVVVSCRSNGGVLRQVIEVDVHSVACALRLDGRPLHDVFAVELERWATSDKRRVLDTLRRYKALGVFCDAEPGTLTEPVDWSSPQQAAA